MKLFMSLYFVFLVSEVREVQDTNLVH